MKLSGGGALGGLGALRLMRVEMRCPRLLDGRRLAG